MIFDRLKSTGEKIRRELKVYQLIAKDDRTPKRAKFLLGLAVGYMLLPFDIIPDFIPVIGHLDDMLIVPLMVIAALKMIPKEIVDDCRRKAEGQST